MTDDDRGPVAAPARPEPSPERRVVFRLLLRAATFLTAVLAILLVVIGWAGSRAGTCSVLCVFPSPAEAYRGAAFLGAVTGLLLVLGAVRGR